MQYLYQTGNYSIDLILISLQNIDSICKIILNSLLSTLFVISICTKKEYQQSIKNIMFKKQMCAETDSVADNLRSLEGGLLPNSSLNSIYSILRNFSGKSHMIRYLSFKNSNLIYIYCLFLPSMN